MWAVTVFGFHNHSAMLETKQLIEGYHRNSRKNFISRSLCCNTIVKVAASPNRTLTDSEAYQHLP